MAAKKARPGRTLVIFFVGVGILYGLVALAGSWKPSLGLDLQGGTSIRLTPEGDPDASALDEARRIIDQRVNASGVAESEVTVQGDKYIVVEIPGDSRRDLVETVRRQAQLRFRLVACTDRAGQPCGTSAATPEIPTEAPQPGEGVVAPSDTPTPEPTPEATDGVSPSGTANRAPAAYGDETPTDTPSETPTDTASDAPTDAPTDAASDEPIPAPEGGPDVDDPLTWVDNPNQEAIDAYNAFTCPTDGSPVNVEDDPEKPLVTCGTDDEAGVKYLLSAAMIEGTQLDDASAQIPQTGVAYVVTLDFNGEATEVFGEISRALVNTEKQFAIVLDGQVLSAPTMDGLILDGNAQISGNFTQESAESLATSLRYGALPISFADFSAETVGPSLAGDQLKAGLTAALVGLILVMLYCLLYYRGLGLVVVASLGVAAAITFAMVLLLAETAGFTLTLPGIAGLIIGVGVTADSFVIFFERIRDEMREGKSMRVAVETGWIRARKTRMAANVVSLLSASVLYIFASGVVKGFGFALGLSTLVDLAVLFWFTKPMVSYLARYKFFNGGGRLSGLSASTLGIDMVTPDRVPVGSRS